MEFYSSQNIGSLFFLFKKDIVQIFATSQQKEEARLQQGPCVDALHFILARDNNCILVTRDKHFVLFSHITTTYVPEDLL